MKFTTSVDSFVKLLPTLSVYMLGNTFPSPQVAQHLPPSCLQTPNRSFESYNSLDEPGYKVRTGNNRKR